MMRPRIEERFRSLPSPRRRIVAGIATGVLLVSACTSGSDTTEADSEEASQTGGDDLSALDEFALISEDGESITLTAWAGEPMVVNYFAAWCPPCRAEIPAFIEVHQTYGDDVAFIGVSRDADEDAWKSFVEETGITYDTLFEGQGAGTFEATGALGMPTTVFIDAEGSILDVHSGVLTAGSLESRITEDLLDG